MNRQIHKNEDPDYQAVPQAALESAEISDASVLVKISNAAVLAAGVRHTEGRNLI